MPGVVSTLRLETFFTGFAQSLAASFKGFRGAGEEPGGAAPGAAAAGPMLVRKLAPMHGPVVKQGLSQLLREYRCAASAAPAL
jgi:hypothetical protein